MAVVVPQPGEKVPLAKTVQDWKDARVVMADEDFDDVVRQCFAAIDAKAKGDEKDGVQQSIDALKDLSGWKDAARVRLMESALTDRDGIVTGRVAAAQGRIEAANAAMAGLTAEAEQLSKEWEEVKEVPALCKQLEGSISAPDWAKRMDRCLEQHSDAKAALRASNSEADEVRCAFHFILHKLAHTVTLSEKLHALAQKHQQKQAEMVGTKRAREE
eukprot:TRINITY_DN11941_c1_g1_i2.p1 TRINITY_DN11941_c1_g1~~TRINITY_DN11941_c1_g1_i2.p1  ORF type:complete len:216 (+),score=92.19 TRINITY_DN11941_c1_g1_i2:94-741(+)